MSKIDLHAKKMTTGNVETEASDSSNEAAASTPIDSFESFGASKWKSISMPANSTTDDMGDVARALGNALKPAIDNGPFGMPAVKPISQFGLLINKTPKNAYLNKFRAVELPPSVEETISLFPDLPDGIDPAQVKKELSSSISEAVSYYNSYLDMYNERKANAVKAIKGGQLGPQDVGLVRQFVAKLDEAIVYTEKQLEELKRFKTDKFGGKDI